MFILNISIFILLGLVAGILAGLLGIGGGIIIVPSLYFIFQNLHSNFAHPMHHSVGTSLSIVTVASLTAVYLYQKRNAIYWPLFKHLLIPLLIGSVFGVFISNITPGTILAKIFAVFALLFGLYLLFIKKPYTRDKSPKKTHLIIGGFFIGFLATLLGIGGGVIAIPLFIMFYRCPNYCLIGNASVATFISSLVGTICFIISGYHSDSSNMYLGYIYIPAFISVSLVSILSVYIGIKLADRLKVKILKKIFAIALIVTSILMFF